MFSFDRFVLAKKKFSKGLGRSVKNNKRIHRNLRQGILVREFVAYTWREQASTAGASYALNHFACLTSAKGQKLEYFKCTADNILKYYEAHRQGISVIKIVVYK